VKKVALAYLLWTDYPKTPDILKNWNTFSYTANWTTSCVAYCAAQSLFL